MTTEYIITDSLPKDKTGAKIVAPIDDSTSQLDFALLRGIATESLGATSKNVAFLGVGSHTAGSAIGTKVGEMMLGIYTNTPSAVGDNTAQTLRVDKYGAMFVRGAESTVSFSAASTQTHVSGSGLLHGIHIMFNDVQAIDTIQIQDGNDTKFSVVANSASGNYSMTFPVGVKFTTSIKHVASITGAGGASVSLIYSQ